MRADPQAQDETLRLDVADAVATLTLDRPERLNAYTPEMGEALVGAIRGLLADEAVRAIVLTGAGRGFCAGADRACLDGPVGASGYRLGEEPFLRGFAIELSQAEKPLIAAVNGPAVGIGVTMILPFDVRIASVRASFDFPFARLGLAPGMGASFFLPRLVGPAAAKRILLSGARLDAAQALAAGLVSEIVEPDALLARAHALALSLIGRDAAIIAALKRVLGAVDRAAIAQAVAAEQAEIAHLAQVRR
jgi:enoyl-CoA hydratase/carnithine racemase